MSSNIMDSEDEDHDVDIETDDEDDSSGKNSGPYQTQVRRQSHMQAMVPPIAEKRAHHNALERKRRDHIKDSFTGLRDSVPTLHGDKSLGGAGDKSSTSRAQILKKAADYIQSMRKKNTNNQADIDNLKRQNQMLDSQIRLLEKGKPMGNFTTAAMMDSTLNSKGDAVSAFDGGSGSESSEPETYQKGRGVKKMRTASPTLRTASSSSASSGGT